MSAASFEHAGDEDDTGEASMPVLTDFSGTVDRAEPADEKALILGSGLFDPCFYAYQLGCEVDAQTSVDHFVEEGSRAGYSPFFGFDTIFYRNRHLDGTPSRNPLVHYISTGAAAGLDTEAAPSGHLIEMVRLLTDSDQFDAPFYNNQLATTQTLSKENACLHYVLFGARLDLQPNRRFDSRYYRRRSPDVVDAGLNPFYHYLVWGEKEGRKASPSDDGQHSRLSPGDVLLKTLFDEDHYVAAYPPVRENHVDPFLHFLNYGWRMGINPNPTFDVGDYCGRNESVDWNAIHPLLHAAIKRVATNERWTEELARMSCIDQLVDAAFYVTQWGDAPRIGLDPLEHYFFIGRHRGLQPNAIFDPIYYASAVAGLPPADAALHYCMGGYQAGVDPHPLFQEAFYNHQAGNDGLPGVVHFLRTDDIGVANPSPLFDCRFYIETYMAPGATSENPLADFLASGGGQDRDPNPWFDSRWYRARYAVCDDIPILDYLNSARRGVVRDPNDLFDSGWYLQVNEDAREVRDPLTHYIEQGRFAARLPSVRFDPVWYAGCYEVADATALAHFLSVGRHIGHLPRPIDKHIYDCDALDIPYVLLRQPRGLAGKKVVLLVTHSRDGRTKSYLRRLAGAYRRQGYDVVLIIAADGVACLDEDLETWTDGVVLRTNHGWDFAAWSVALSCLPDIWKADQVILTNDSLYGPISDEVLATCLSRCEAADAAISVMTDSFQVKYHYMSFFTFLSKQALASADLQRFWSGIRSNVNKDVVIFEYEIRSAERFRAFGLSVQVLFPSRGPAGELAINPTLDAWRELIASGFPFLKRQLVREFDEQPRARGWRAMIPAPLREEIDHDVAAKPDEDRSFGFPLPKPRYLSPNRIKTFYGAVQSVRPADPSDVALEIPFDRALHPDAPRARRILVHAHVFYTEMADEILAYLANIPCPFDLVVTTDLRSKASILEHAVRESGLSADIRIVPNKGRDIAPLLVALGEDLRNHDVVLHVHTKKSPHNSEYAGWREYLLEAMLGTKEKCASILALLDLQDVGMVFPQHFSAIRHLLNYGGNFPIMRRLAQRLGFELSTDLVLEFPSGSFFWARTAALHPLLALDLGWDDFPDEAGQVDGTMAHALERLLIHSSEAAKYKWVKVGGSDRPEDCALVRPQKLLGLTDTVERMHRPILWNPIMSRKEKKILVEYNPLLFRPEATERARFNLFLPTLAPEKMFGGALTALQVFNTLVEASAADARIIVSSEPVRLTGLLGVPGYRLCPMSDTSDLSRIVVDANEHQRGYLPVRANDIFVATAWWTFLTARDARRYQKRVHGRAHDLIYLVQDYEAAFYPWSYRHSLASDTLAETNVVGIVNSEELASAIAGKLGFGKTFVMPYRINAKLASSLRRHRREKILLFYGRPSVDRNAFDAIQGGIAFWTARRPVDSDGWRIVAVGERFPRELWRGKADIEILGKLTLDEYGDLLGRALVGISLMISPHPSYPPLEMAAAGITTITNSFEGKDLRSRSENILTIRDLRPETIGEAIAVATSRRASDAGQYGTIVDSVHDLQAPFAAYEPGHLLTHFRDALPPVETRSRHGA